MPATVLRTLNETGDIAPDLFPPPWSLHLGIPDTLGTPEVRILANGFELHYPEMAPPARVRCLMTADGCWTGEATLELHPTLFSPEMEVIEQENGVAIVTNGRASALSVDRDGSRTRFCLCVDGTQIEAAMEEARAGLPTDLDGRWDRESALRAQFWSEIAELDCDVEILRTALETLVYHLEPAGDGGLRWAAALPALADANLNALYPLIQSWLSIDPGIASRLLQSTLAGIREDGILPARLGPEDTSADAAAWPLLMQTCLLCQEAMPESDLVTRSLPQLEKYLVATLERVDPNHRGLPAWLSATESFIPDAHDDQVASTALSAMLLQEIDAFFILTESLPEDCKSLPILESARDRLIGNLSTDLYDQENGICLDRYIDGDPIARVTLSGLLPLGVKRLPPLLRAELLRKVSDPAYFGAEAGLALWQAWATDDEPPPAPSAYQLFVLNALESGGDATTELEELYAEGIARWFKARDALPLDLRTGAIEAADPAAPMWYESALMAACLTLRTVPAVNRQQAEAQMPAYLMALDRHRYTLLLVLIVAIAGSVTLSMLGSRRRPIEVVSEREGPTQLVVSLMAKGEYGTARARLDELKQMDDALPALAFIDGKLLFREGQYPEAVAAFEQCIQDGVAIPRANINLGLSLYHAGRLEDAIAQYELVIEELGAEYPPAQKIAETAIRIIRRHGSAVVPLEPALPPAE